MLTTREGDVDMDGHCPEMPSPCDITAFFDSLLIEGADVSKLIERSSIFTGTTVGRIRTDGLGAAYSTGRLEPRAKPSPDARRGPVTTGGQVWVEGLPDSLSVHFVDRLAVAVAVVERWGITGNTAHMRPIDVLVDPTMSASAKSAARVQLGLTPETPVRIAICSGPADQVEILAESIDAAERVLARTTRQGRSVMMLAARPGNSVDIQGVPVGIRAAYGRATPAAEVEFSYDNARDAYRFTRPSTHKNGPYQAVAGVWLNGSRISGLQALCRLSTEDIAAVPEIKDLDALAEHHGPQILTVLEAYAITSSVRKAAEQVHMHHNSVAYWIQKTESELGYSLTEPYRRAQLFITLSLYRLWKYPDDRVE
ncbi:helix-turn-helix domain-containing protein [Rhodococcus fascians]|nr:helix-turn-helix domain-containing protein [Rhodococcus fascians]MBY4114663.1 helix-turn-helix domain-containing protein [Rhodococcus fascians]